MGTNTTDSVHRLLLCAIHHESTLLHMQQAALQARTWGSLQPSCSPARELAERTFDLSQPRNFPRSTTRRGRLCCSSCSGRSTRYEFWKRREVRETDRPYCLVEEPGRATVQAAGRREDELDRTDAVPTEPLVPTADTSLRRSEDAHLPGLCRGRQVARAAAG